MDKISTRIAVDRALEDVMATLVEESSFLDPLSMSRLMSAQGYSEITGLDSRKSVIESARRLARRHPLAKNALRIWESFVVSSGATIYPLNRNTSDTLWNQVDLMIHGPDNREIFGYRGQRAVYRRLLDEGEVYFVVFSGRRPKVRMVPTSTEIVDQISDPDDAAKILYYVRRYQPEKVEISEDGKIKREAGGEQTQIFRSWDASDEDLIRSGIRVPKALLHPTATVVAVKINVFESRGYPLLEPVITWSNAFKTFMEDRVNISRALAKFIWKISGEADTNVLQRAAQMLSAQTTSAGLLQTNDQVKIEPMRASNNSSDALRDARLLRQMIGAGVGITEPNLTGDPSVGNLASLTAMDSAMQRNFILDQVLLADAMRDIIAASIMVERSERALEEAIEWVSQNVGISYPSVVMEDVEGRVRALVEAAGILPRYWLQTEIMKTLGERYPERILDEEEKNESEDSGELPDDSGEEREL